MLFVLNPWPLNVCGGQFVLGNGGGPDDRRPSKTLQRHATRHGSQKLGFVNHLESKSLAAKTAVGRGLRSRHAEMNPAAVETTKVKAFVSHG
jgi:hypothetical protein